MAATYDDDNKGDFSLNGKRVGEIGYFGKRLNGGLAINFPKTFEIFVFILIPFTIQYGHRNKAPAIVYVMRKRNKPKDSWVQRAKREIENADYLLILRNLELKLIRKQKERTSL